jgi:hypothetical protein
MQARKILFVISAVAIVCGGALVWFALHLSALAKLEKGTIFTVTIGAFCILPLFPLYGMARRWPQLRIGIILAMCSLISTLVVDVVFCFYHDISTWTEQIVDLQEIVLIGGAIALIWCGAKMRRK